MNWQYCTGCQRKQPIPGCPQCEKLNERSMTQAELDELTEANRLDNEKTFALDIKDVPFEDGTTPRQRKAIARAQTIINARAEAARPPAEWGKNRS
jgi:hypothetical protein